MRSQLILVLLVGFAASTYAYHLSDAKKRSLEEEQRIFSFLSDLYADVIYQPLNHVVTSLALLGAQILAGISQSGIPAPGGRTIHPSEAELRNFFADLWNNAVKPPIENAIQSTALMLAQVLAGVGVNGISLGKRDLAEVDARFLETLTQTLTEIVQKPIENALQSAALMLAQVLAGVGVNGIDLSSLFGKRDLTEVDARFLETLTQTLTEIVQKPIENALQSAALMLAQVLAGVGVNGIDLSSLFGKRELEAEARGPIIDNIVDHATGLFTTQVKPVIENALNAAALHLAGVLANFSQTGFGRR